MFKTPVPNTLIIQRKRGWYPKMHFDTGLVVVVCDKDYSNPVSEFRVSFQDARVIPSTCFGSPRCRKDLKT